MKKTFPLFGLVLALAPFSASADSTFTYPASSPVLSISFPDDWKVTADPEAASKGLIATSSDEAIELDLWALEKSSDPKKAVEAIEETGKEIAGYIDEYVTEFELEGQKKGAINGISAATFEGKGKSKEDGEEVNVEVTLLSPDGKQLFAMMYWGSDEAEKTHAAALQKIGASLKKP